MITCLQFLIIEFSAHKCDEPDRAAIMGKITVMVENHGLEEKDENLNIQKLRVGLGC